MYTFQFEGIGTSWVILIDDPGEWNFLETEILKIVKDFDQAYSRFIPSSLITNINQSSLSVIEIPSELTELLTFGLRLKQSTNGAFDPHVADIMEAYGYDQNYSFKIDTHKLDHHQSVEFNLEQNTLVKKGALLVDIGGWGKGYLIDKIAEFLKEEKVQYFLVDGGGDMVGTTKQDGQSWTVALENPLDISQAIGKVAIINSALAGSASNRRKVGDFHHLVNAKTGKPIQGVAGVFVQAKTAMVADGTATAIYVTLEEYWDKIRKEYGIEYLVIRENGGYKKSLGFDAALFD